MSDHSTDDTDDPIDASTEDRGSIATTPVTSNYKVLGELTDASGVGVLGQNDAASGTPLGVEGAVPNASDGFGLATDDDARIAGTIDAAETDFRVEAGTTATSDATNVVLGHASNSATSGVSGGVVGGGGYDDGSTGLPNRVFDDYGTVGGGRGNRTGASGAVVALFATVGGGEGNVASDDNATVGGGTGNLAGDTDTTVGGGDGNTAGGTGATVGGGSSNDATQLHTTVAGGTGNEASGSYATVGGGRSNTASARQATVGGGGFNDATGLQATVPGGRANVAGGDASFAAGEFAAADDDSSFVWNDGSGASDGSGSQTDRFSSSTSDSTSSVVGSNTVNVKTTSGIRVITAGDNSAVTWIPGGSAGWSSSSTRRAKTNIDPVDPQAVLDGVTELEVSTWEYANQDDGGQGMRHMGPMAEEFHDVFDVGTSDTGINSINVDGVALAAIQGLAERLDAAREELDAKDDRIDDLERENEQLRERVAALEDWMREPTSEAGSSSPPADG